MRDLQKEILTHLQERGWDKLRPGDIAKSIMIEGAELLEHFQWVNPSLEEVKADEEKKKALSKELADVIIYALEMAALLELDADTIVREKLAHVAKKYPAELMKKNAVEGAGSGADAEYWKIKNAYRQKGE